VRAVFYVNEVNVQCAAATKDCDVPSEFVADAATSTVVVVHTTLLYHTRSALELKPTAC
jgi:hypothetical protein